MLVPGHTPAPMEFDLLSEFGPNTDSRGAKEDSPETLPPLRSVADPVSADAPEIEIQAELEGVDDDSLAAVNWSAWKRDRKDESDPTGIPETPPPEMEPLSSILPPDSPEDDLIVESTLEGLDDLMLSSGSNLPVASETAGSAGEDPFTEQDDAPLQIEGVTPGDSEFPIYCKICGTLVYGRLSQVGSSIKCPDCYSPIPVVKPTNEEKLRPVARKPKEPTDDLEYRLAPPPELPPIDTTIDTTLGELDFDDDAFFEKRRALQEARDSKNESDDLLDEVAGDLPQARDEDIGSVSPGSAASAGSRPYESPPISAPPDSAAATDSQTPETDPRAVDDEPDHGYSIVDEMPADPKADLDSIDDLLSQYHASDATPQSVEIEGRSPDKPVRVAPVADRDESPAEEIDMRGSRSESLRDGGNSVAKPSSPKKTRPRQRSKRSDEHTDIPSPMAEWGSWITKAFRLVFRRNNVTRMAMATAVLTIAALLIGSGLALLDPENNYFYNFGGWAVFLIGCVPLLGFLLFFGVFGNHAIRRAMDDDYDEDELPDFSFAEWGGQFVFMAIGIGLAALPGLLLGHVIWVATEQFWFLPGLAIVTAVLGSPLLLASVVFDDSPFALFSARTFRSVRGLRFRWLRYWACGLILALAVALAAWGAVQGVFLAVICSVAIVLALNLICWMLGDLLGYVVRWKEHEIEQRSRA